MEYVIGILAFGVLCMIFGVVVGISLFEEWRQNNEH